jgi:hypothetical protein
MDPDTALADRALSVRELQFAHEFVKDGNGARAYQEAGYRPASPGDAAHGATRLKAKPHVAAYIRQLQTELIEDLGIHPRYILAKHKGIIENEATENRDRIACLNACTRMLGFDKPTTHDVRVAGAVLLKWGDE